MENIDVISEPVDPTVSANVNSLMTKAKSLHNSYGEFPVVAMPQDEGIYEFPLNADNLSDDILDTWLVKLGAWRGYAINKIAENEGEIGLLSEGYDLMVLSKIADLEATSTKKLLKDSLKGMILNDNPDLLILAKKVMVLKAELKILKGRLSLYDTHFEAISRVITRRGQERQRS